MTKNHGPLLSSSSSSLLLPPPHSVLQENRKLKKTLTVLYNEIADYLRLNNLGPHNRSMRAAHELLLQCKQREFWKKVKVLKPHDCWPWKLSCKGGGYGITRFNGKSAGAHRVAWFYTNGPFRSDLDVAHRCDNERCCNPRHLFLTNDSGNLKDARDKDRLGVAKLKRKQALTIQRSHKSQTYLAKKYGISLSEVCRIKGGSRWNP